MSIGAFVKEFPIVRYANNLIHHINRTKRSAEIKQRIGQIRADYIKTISTLESEEDKEEAHEALLSILERLDLQREENNQ